MYRRFPFYLIGQKGFIDFTALLLPNKYGMLFDLNNTVLCRKMGYVGCHRFGGTKFDNEYVYMNTKLEQKST